jgi:hypothetical protein
LCRELPICEAEAATGEEEVIGGGLGHPAPAAK